MAKHAERAAGSSGEEPQERSASYAEEGRQEARLERSTEAINEALSRLAELVGGSPSAPLPRPMEPGPESPGPLPLPGSVAAGVLSMPQRAEIARSCLYCMGMPILTPERIKEIETSLPELIALLRSLSYRPTLRSEVLQSVEATKQQMAAQERNAEGRFNELVGLVASDLSAQGERLAPAVGVAIFLGSYLVAKYW